MNRETEQQLRLMAQVQALELVLKTALALLFASQMKDGLEAAEKSELVRHLSERLQAHVQDMLTSQQAAQLGQPEMADLMRREMQSAVARCFGETEAFLKVVGDISLDLAAPATGAKN